MCPGAALPPPPCSPSWSRASLSSLSRAPRCGGDGMRPTGSTTCHDGRGAGTERTQCKALHWAQMHTAGKASSSHVWGLLVTPCAAM